MIEAEEGSEADDGHQPPVAGFTFWGVHHGLRDEGLPGVAVLLVAVQPPQARESQGQAEVDAGDGVEDVFRQKQQGGQQEEAATDCGDPRQRMLPPRLSSNFHTLIIARVVEKRSASDVLSQRSLAP